MKNLFLFIFICCFALFNACTEQDASIPDEAVVLNFVPDKSNEPRDLFVTSFIKLETNDTCFIDKSIVQLECAADKLFILSGGSDKKLLVFDMEGNFLDRIGTVGSGPGEFVAPLSFSIDSVSDKVSVVDIAQQKILEYRLSDFSFIGDKQLGFYSSCFEYVNEGQLLLKNDEAKSSFKEWSFLLANPEPKVIDHFVNKTFVTGYSTGYIKNIYKLNDEVYAYAQYNPVIYRFRAGKMEPVYFLKFGDIDLLPQDYLEKIAANNANFIGTLDVSDYIFYYGAWETAKALSVYYTAGQKGYIGSYNKQSQQVHSFPKTYFEDNLKVGHMDRPSGTLNEFTAAVLQPFDLLGLLDENYQFTPELKLLLKNTDEEDNPILFLYKYKG